MRQVLGGSTDVSTNITIVDSGDGTPETGVTSVTAGLALEYVRLGAAPVSITESDLVATNSAHSDGGMKHLGYGHYRLDLPDAAVATGVDTVDVIGTVTGMIVLRETIQITGYNPRTELTTARLTELDNMGTLDDGAITANKIATGAITAAKFAASAIDATVAPNLDAAVSSRAPSATALSNATWTNALATALGTAASTIASLLDVAVSTRAAASTALSNATWTNVLATALTTAAATIASFLDAAISSRAAAATALSTVQWTNGRAAALDNLDATISSRGTADPGDEMDLAANAVDAAALAANASTEIVTALLATAITGGTVKTALEAAITGGAGAGALTYVYTLTSSVDSTPVDDCAVWVTTDSAGTNVIASGRTNASGVVTFYLDAGTYYFWRSKSGWNFTNPDTEVVA